MADSLFFLNLLEKSSRNESSSHIVSVLFSFAEVGYEKKTVLCPVSAIFRFTLTVLNLEVEEF